ncbi:ATP-binding protein, partial [Streptomyces sp. WAC02707]|uniref:ATP-binding protein n=1 Tax=Streptomyces sp. WAC02707 TaxID=2487417 RepID=UPI0021AFBB2D
MPTSPRRGRLPAEREDHFMRLPGAQVVSTRALLTARENIRAAIDAKAMICIYGQAGNGKSFAVNACLRELAPKLTRRIQFRARPSTRDLRHELFHALGLQGRPPTQPIEFDRTLRVVVRLRDVAVTAAVDEGADGGRRVLMMWRHRFVTDTWAWELPM